MKKNLFRKGMSALLAVVMSLSAFIGMGTTTAFAAEADTDEVVMISFPRDGDENYSADWGHDELHYMNGWYANESKKVTVYTVGSWNGNACYCIEPGTPLTIGDTVTKRDETYWDNYPSTYNSTISADEIKLFIGRIFQYGYTGTVTTEWRSQNAADADKMAHIMATQTLIWETVVGERDSDFNHVDTGSYDAVKDRVSTSNPLYSRYISYYNSMETNVQKHSKVPSFFAKSTSKAKEIELTWNGTNYTATLTDTNDVLSDYTFAADKSGITFSVSGNKLTISADTAPSGKVTITATKTGSVRKGVVVWTDGVIKPGVGIQDLSTFSAEVNDPVKGYLNIKVSLGTAKIVKTSEDGRVSGVSFTITGNGVNKTVTTDANGEITVDNLSPGTYTVTESTENKYETQPPQTVTVISGQTATVTFNNTLKRGSLTVTKTSEDGLNSGIKFHLYGTSLSGLKVDEYSVTDSSGKAYFNDVLIGTGYTLKEVDTAVRYVIPEKQTVNIEWNTVTNKTFNNTLKKWKLTVTKSDSQSGTPQGNAALSGAVYGVYKGEQLIDSYTTDKNGQFTTKYYVCGDDWTLREISPSEGYLVNTAKEHIGVEAKNYTVEYNAAVLDVTETVKKGKIALIKHADDGSTQIETPEVNAEFKVYLKSSGSYENAKDSERDILVTDKYGYAETKSLPYGVYTVEQIKGLDGKELMPPFDVFISENGEVYRYLINNRNFESYLHVVKMDSTTGKTIPYAGAGFQIYAPDGSLVTMSYTYPTLTVIDTFYTDENGTLLTPEKLPYGEGYSLVEVQAPHGYVLDATPIYFDVTKENSADENGITIVKVVKANEPQKGTITITKTGEVFSSVVESDGAYQPVYEIKGLAGAIYEIAASEDVVTLDGTLRYKKGDVVGTITTGVDGTATTEPLFLGKFEIREITAPYGMLLNGNTVTAELTYAGQEIKITTTSAAFVNERQKVKIELAKALEQDEKYGIGMNGEITSIKFGLYATEDIIATDGKIIPQNGLIETVACNKDGKAVFATDLPIGAKVYVKEIATDSHYILSDNTYPVTFDYAGQDTAVVEISVNNGEPITNEIIRGNIIGKKLDEDGFTIGGATFGLFRENETVFTEETAIAVSQSNEIGIFTFENLPYGRWLIREIKAAPAFVLNENSYAVTVGADKEIIEITIENKFLTGSVKTTKVDKEYPDNKLTGAVFEVYVDVDANGEFDPAIDLFIGEMTETEEGIYEMHDLRYNGYFLYEKTAPEGFLKDDGYHYFEIRNDGETVTVENEAGVGFTNKPITGKLELTKTDISDGKALANVGFRISNEAGEIVAEGYTDKNGVAKFTLRYGKYTYEEFAALDGYIQDTEKYPFEIREDGEIVKVTMTNEKIPEVPQTGDESNIGFWIGLAAVALGGVIATSIVLIKKKKDDENE